MTQVVQFAKPGADRSSSGGFVMTETAQDMLRSLQLVKSLGGDAITMIAAVPGTGKTQALRHFRDTVMPRAIFHTAIAGEGTPWGVACQLMELLEIGVPNSRDLLGSRRSIAEEIGAEGLLIVDEAQHLVQRNPRGKDNWDALEWLRAMAEEGMFSLVFCGDLGLLDTAHKLPQLWRRMRRRVIVKTVTKADVEILCVKRGISDATVIAVLFQIARRGGGLGDVDNAISHARLLSGGGSLGKAHVMAALEDLKLVPKGGV
jgi:DNA transposition AAA+ family ATPase